MIARSRGTRSHPYLLHAVRIVVALRDWGPLRFDDLLDDTELPPGGLARALHTLRRLGYVKRKRGNTWAIGPKGAETVGGLRFFGCPAGRRRPS